MHTPERVNGTFRVKAAADGDYAVSRMSEKAREYYNGAGGFVSVYEFQDCETNRYYYSVRGEINEGDGLTFSELEQLFEEYADIYNKD